MPLRELTALSQTPIAGFKGWVGTGKRTGDRQEKRRQLREGIDEGEGTAGEEGGKEGEKEKGRVGDRGINLAPMVSSKSRRLCRRDKLHFAASERRSSSSRMSVQRVRSYHC